MFEKLINIQAELKAPKNQYNSFGKYKYRSCEDILEGVKPLLKKYGLFLKITDDVFEAAGRFYIKSTAIITDGEKEISATGLAREPENKKGMDESQITGTASSYARKYALNGLFCIDDTKDSDTDEHKREQDKPSNKPASVNNNKPVQGEGDKLECPKCNGNITKGALENFGMCPKCKQLEKGGK